MVEAAGLWLGSVSLRAAFSFSRPGSSTNIGHPARMIKCHQEDGLLVFQRPYMRIHRDVTDVRVVVGPKDAGGWGVK